MNNGKILIVEDEKKISDIVKSYLERDGFNVAVAETGREALKLMNNPAAETAGYHSSKQPYLL